jgi:GT2 family glycosyltransferase
MAYQPTLLIATRNRADQLRPCLESLRQYPAGLMRVMVVDDGSTDDTGRVLRQVNGLVHQVVALKRTGGYRKNPGPVWNIGHRMTDSLVVFEQGGEVVHLTDCVRPLLALCRPGVVALARVHNGRPEEMARVRSDIAAGSYRFPPDYEIADTSAIRTDAGRWLAVKMGTGRGELYCGVERPVPFLFLGAIHREDFEAVGGYDEKLSGRNDEDLANRLIARGTRFVWSGRAVAFHLNHGKS